MRVPTKHGFPLRTPGRVSISAASTEARVLGAIWRCVDWRYVPVMASASTCPETCSRTRAICGVREGRSPPPGRPCLGLVSGDPAMMCGGAFSWPDARRPGRCASSGGPVRPVDVSRRPERAEGHDHRRTLARRLMGWKDRAGSAGARPDRPVSRLRPRLSSHLRPHRGVSTARRRSVPYRPPIFAVGRCPEGAAWGVAPRCPRLSSSKISDDDRPALGRHLAAHSIHPRERRDRIAASCWSVGSATKSRYPSLSTP